MNERNNGNESGGKASSCNPSQLFCASETTNGTLVVQFSELFPTKARLSPFALGIKMSISCEQGDLEIIKSLCEEEGAEVNRINKVREQY